MSARSHTLKLLSKFAIYGSENRASAMRSTKKCSLCVNKSVSGEIIPIAHFQWDLSSPKPSTYGQEMAALPTFASLNSVFTSRGGKVTRSERRLISYNPFKA